MRTLSAAVDGGALLLPLGAQLERLAASNVFHLVNRALFTLHLERDLLCHLNVQTIAPEIFSQTIRFIRSQDICIEMQWHRQDMAYSSHLGLLVEDWLGLTSEARLFAVVTTLTLGEEGILALLVLGNLPLLMVLTLRVVAIGLHLLREVHHGWCLLNTKKNTQARWSLRARQSRQTSRFHATAPASVHWPSRRHTPASCGRSLNVRRGGQIFLHRNASGKEFGPQGVVTFRPTQKRNDLEIIGSSKLRKVPQLLHQRLAVYHVCVRPGSEF